MRNILLTFLMALLYGQALHAQSLFSDGFESGDFQAGRWMPTGNVFISQENPASGMYCARGEGAYGLNKIITNLNQDNITIEFKVRPGQTLTTCMIFRIRDSSHAAANTGPGIILNNNGIITGVNGGGQGNLKDLDVYDENQWYHFKLDLHMRSGLYDIYINGVAKAKDFQFFSRSFKKPYFMTWNSIETTGNVSYDDFLIYETGTVGLSEGNLWSRVPEIFPNPSTGRLHMDLKNPQSQIMIKLSDSQGRLVFQSNLGDSRVCDLNLSHLPSGIYPYVVYQDQKIIHQGLWVKE